MLPTISNAELKRGYSVSEEAANRMRAFAFRQKAFFLPGSSTLVLEVLENVIVMHSFLGTMVNEALSRVVSSLLTASLGSAVRTRVSPYCILFEFSKRYPVEKFVRLLKELNPEKAGQMLLNAVPSTSLFRFRFIHVAKRFGFIRRDADYKDISIKRIVEEQRGSPVFDEAAAETVHDKMDLTGMVALLKGISSGKIHVQVFDGQKHGLSPLAKDFLEFRGYSELMAPPEPTAQIIQAFRQNLSSKTVALLCTHCGKTFSNKIGELGEKIKCPYCDSSQIAPAKYLNIFEKKKIGKGMLAADRKEHAEMLKAAAILSSYGSNGAAALETYGIGPETASRVLRRAHKNDEEVFKDLLEAQKTFVRTKRYWS